MYRGIVCIAAVFAAAFCSAAGLSFCIGTEGVDRYADGTPVLEGERYGLVFVPAGKTFAGVHSDGALVNPSDNSLHMIGKVANGEHRLPICSYTAADDFAGGTAYLVVFDTRTPDGGVNGPVVNGWGIAASVTLPASSSSASAARALASAFASASDGSAAQVAHSSSLPASVPASAIIEKMEFVGDEVWLTVRNTGSAAYYAAAGAEDLSAADFETRGFSSAVRGATAADGTIIVKYPKSAAARFFKVKGGTLMDL